MKKNSNYPIRPVPQQLPSVESRLGIMQGFDVSDEVQLRQYWKVVLKYRFLLLSIIGVCFGISALYAFLVTPRYTAFSKIRINTYEPVLAATKVEDVLQEKSKESHYLETQIQEIKSYSMADKVLEDDSIRKALFASSEDSSELSAGRVPVDSVSGYKHSIRELNDYLNLLEIAPLRRTSLVQIYATTSNPELAARIANVHAQTYINWVRENWVEQQSHSLHFLKQQATELREKVVELEREMADYAEENSIIAVNKDENITAQRMAQLNELLTRATAKKIELQNQYKEASNGLLVPGAGFDDSSAKDVRTDLSRLEAEYAQLSAKFTPQYPRMKQLKGQIEGLKKSLVGQRSQIVEGLKQQMQAAESEEQRLTEELELQKSQAFELSKREVQYNVLDRELSSSRELLQNVLRQIKETALAVEGKSSNVTIVDFALIPRFPSFPNKLLVLFLGLIAGLGLGLGVAFLLNYLDNTVRTPEELSSLSAIPNLGVVPSFLQIPSPDMKLLSEGADKRGQESRAPVVSVRSNLEPVVFLDEPKSLAAEAYRTIRTGILLSQAGEPPRTLLITSAQSSEGKTTTTMNLAASLASAGGSVVLVDADLRRPSLARYFSLEPGMPGLVDVITGQASLDAVMLPNTLLSRVTLIPVGKIPPNPAELLGSIEMAAIIDRLAAQFDYVLIDSPPILPVTDSVILSRYVDGVVMVVKGNSTPRAVITEARDRIIQVGARLIGTILNDIDTRAGDYYYYNRYYSSYYSEESSETGRGSKRRA